MPKRWARAFSSYTQSILVPQFGGEGGHVEAEVGADINQNFGLADFVAVDELVEEKASMQASALPSASETRTNRCEFAKLGCDKCDRRKSQSPPTACPRDDAKDPTHARFSAKLPNQVGGLVDAYGRQLGV